MSFWHKHYLRDIVTTPVSSVRFLLKRKSLNFSKCFLFLLMTDFYDFIKKSQIYADVKLVLSGHFLIYLFLTKR